MKIALFRNTQFSYVSPWPWDSPPVTEGYVQVSGWVEVEFPPLSEEEQKIADELLALGKRQQTFEADFRKQRRELEAQRKTLMEKLEKTA